MKLRRALQRYSLLIRLIAVLLLFVLVPMLVYNMMITRRGYQDYAQNREQACLALLSQYEIAFRSNYEAMCSLVQDMGMDSRFQLAALEEKSINVHEATRAMRLHYGKRVKALRIGLYYGGEKLYTNDGAYGLENYIWKILGRVTNRVTISEAFEGEVAVYEEMREALAVDRTDVRYLSISTRAGDTLLVVMPAYISGSGRAVAIFEMNSLLGLTGTIDKSLGSLAYGILGQDGKPLYLSGDVMEQALLAEPTLQFLQSENCSVALGGQNEGQSLYKISNNAFGLTFLLLAEPVASETSLNGMLSLLSHSVGYVAVLFTLLCIITVYLSYAPMKRLVHAARGMGVVKDDLALDETQTIISAMENMQRYNRELCQSAMLQRDALISNLLVNLVEGRSVDKQMLLRYGIVLDGGNMCVMLAANLCSLQEIVHGVYTPMLKNGFRVYCADPAYDGAAVFIASIPNEDQKERMRCAAVLRKEILRQGNPQAVVCVGSAVCCMEELHLSYLTANSAREQGEGEIRMFDDAVKEFSMLERFPSEKMLKMIQYIKQGERSRAAEMLEAAFAAIRTGEPLRIRRQYLHMNLTHMFSETLMKQGISVSTEDMGRLLYANDDDALLHAMQAMANRACDEMAEAKQERSRQFEDAVRIYVEENIRNPNFNLSILSERFQTPSYTMSRTFRRLFGMGFNEYVTVRRMEYAKEELILSPDKDVRTIAQDAGYSDPSYFNKVFKSVCGITPSQFRKG